MRAIWQLALHLILAATTVVAGPPLLAQVPPGIPLTEVDPNPAALGKLWVDADYADIQRTTLLLQQPADRQPAPPTQPPPRPTSTRSGNIRLASVTNMLGDLGGATVSVGIDDDVSNQSFKSDIDVPIGGGSRIGKIAENDNPIPTDRVFFNYNHFHNAFAVSEQPLIGPEPATIRQRPIDRYTIGFEKTFWDGWSSVEVRMPFFGSIDTNLQSVGIGSDNIGNLAVVLKGLLYLDDVTAVGAGMAIATPTGSDIFTRLGDTRLRFQNNAVHLLPYIGFIMSPGDPTWGWGEGLFVTGFAQIDIAASGHRVDVLNPVGVPAGSLGTLSEQNLLFFDLAVGYWLYRDPDAERLTGIAAIGEFHYTTTVQDADILGGSRGLGDIVVGSTQNRFDVVNFTAGLQFLLFDASSLRIGGVFPLASEDQRLFDSEIQVQFNRRF
jgi:hypothetical protein